MIISIDDKLASLFSELSDMGYEVHKSSENINSDIIIYSGGSGNLYSLYNSIPVSDVKGVFLINGDNKSGMEIFNIINNRAYSSIF